MVDVELMLQLLDAALSVEDHQPGLSHHWVLECCPFPLLYVLSQLLNQTLRFVFQPRSLFSEMVNIVKHDKSTTLVGFGNSHRRTLCSRLLWKPKSCW